MHIDSPCPVRRDSDPGRHRTALFKAVHLTTKLSQSTTSCSLPSVANTTKESKSTVTGSGIKKQNEATPESSGTPQSEKDKEAVDDNTSQKTSMYSEQSSSNEVSLKRGELISGLRFGSFDFEPGASPVVCIGDPSTSKDIDKTELNPKNYVKCSNVLVGFAPVKKKKNYYAVLSKRAFELHESEKSFRKGVTAKHIVDLATAFNVHNDHFDTKLKKCLCLMGPDETLVIRTETKELTAEWYDAILQSLLPSRQLKLGRPCYAHEIFEAVYDIEVVRTQKNVEKYKKQVKEAGYTNICETTRGMEGVKRLCFYSHTVILANRRIEPTTVGCPDSGCPPFRADAIVEFPRQLIASFGCQDRYFFLRLGRGIILGNSELLVQCDNHEMATAIHHKMSHIIDREAGRRTNMTMPATLQQHHQRHRDRSNTLNDSCHSCGDRVYRSEPFPGMESLSVPSPHLHHNKLSLDSTPILSVKDRRLLLRDCLSFASSVEMDDSAPSSPFGNNSRPRCSLGNFQLDHLARLEHPRGSIHSLGGLLSDRPRRASNTIRLVKEEPGLRDAMQAARIPKKFSSQSDRQEMNFDEASRKFSSARSDIQDTLSERGLTKSSKANSTNTLTKTGKKLGKSTSIYSTLVSSDGLHEGSLVHREDNNPRSLRAKGLLAPPCSIDETYTNMTPSDWNYGPNAHLIVPLPYPPKEEKYNLEEVRSYVSDSSDSCYSSMVNNSNAQLGSVGQKGNLAALNAPRANSFGGRSINGEEVVKKPVPGPSSKKNMKPSEKTKTDEKDETSSNSLSIPAEDPRKRAFSLGSKNFFNFIGLNEFRRLVKKPLLSGRPSSPNHTSTSGISLNSSPASSSTNYLTSSEMHDDPRISSHEVNTFISTSGSFGSGRSSPFGRHTYTLPPANRDNEHHMEIDFSTMSFGRGCGSSGSIDSPNRLIRREELMLATPNFSFEHHRDDKKLRPSEKVIQQHHRQQLQNAQQAGFPNKETGIKKVLDENRQMLDTQTQIYEREVYDRQQKQLLEKQQKQYQQMQQMKQMQSREMDDYHSKASLCELIVEEKEDTDSNVEFDERSSDTRTGTQSSSSYCEPSTSSAHQYY
ncbi:unnamed protein product [Caenorhabditis angaria]|uniref:PH domain-containing protein n=1 Tax=Caenorhabditis angaria TaxID=860376 RepID=A0A9P1J6I2_9PELO|nr:unnamed protein product [Caenorhabditis angaria]